MTRRPCSVADVAVPLPAKRVAAALDHHAARAARSLLGSSGGPSCVLAFSAKQLAQALGYKHQHSVWQLVREDKTFPRPVQLVPRGEWRWLRAQVEEWLERKARGAA